MAIHFKNLNFWLVSAVTLFGSLGFAGFWTMLAFYITDYLGQAPSYISIYLVSGVLASMLIAPPLARYFDRGKIEQKRALYLTALAGVVWILVFYFTRNFWLVWALNISIVALAGSGWSLIVSYAKVQSRLFGVNANDAVMFNRAMFSLGWCIGPAIGGAVVSEFGFETLFLVMLGFSLLTLLFIYILPPLDMPVTTDLSENEQKRKLPKRAKILLLAFWLLNTAMASAMVLISFHIISIGGGEKEAGRAFAIAAFIEIPVLIFSAKLLNLLNHTYLLVLIFAMSVITYFGMSVTLEVYQLYAMQVFGGVMVALAVGIGMVLIQDTMPDSPAIIMAHYSNMLRFATLVGGGLIGFFVEYFATDDLLVAISTLPAIGMVIVLVWLKRL
ncbi:MAG: MFS transporter [Alphaproteobacteria bacterium]|nr:MFS transporter [Alphaproteobacteria bacterium]